MREALGLAEEALSNNEVPVACLFHHPTRGVLARSHNATNRTKNATSHCQVLCIRQVQQRFGQDAALLLAQITVYVTVEPCIMCAHALVLAGVKEVFFGCHNDRFGGNGSILDLGTHPKTGGLLGEEAKALLTRFYGNGNQTLPQHQRHRKKRI